MSSSSVGYLKKKKTLYSSIVYSTNNTIGKLLTARHQQPKCKYEECGIYKITCLTCNMKYTGETGRPFMISFQEHFRDYMYGNRKSRFVQHLMYNRHSIGFFRDIMDVVHITRKGRMLDTLEKVYIFRETKLNNQISDRLAIKPNIIFETIVRHDHYRALPNSYTQDSQQPSSVLQYAPYSSQ